MRRIKIWKLFLAVVIAAPGVAFSVDWNAENIGGPYDKFPPSLVSWGGNNLGAFVRRTNDSIWYRLKTGGSWGPWTDLQGCSFAPPKVASWGPNHIAVFIMGCNTTTLKYKEFNGSTWSSSWTNLPGNYNTSPSIVSLGVGHLAVLIRGNDENVYALEFSNGVWSGQQSLGFSTDTFVEAVATGPQQIAVFAKSKASIPQLHYRVRTAGTWNAWASLGGDLVTIKAGLCETQGHGAGFAPTSWGNGHMAVFAMKSGTLQYRNFVGGSWTPWQLVPGVTEVPTRIRTVKKSTKVGTLDVFYSDVREFCNKRDEDFRLLHSRLEGSTWTNDVIQSDRLVALGEPIAPGPGRMNLLAGGESSATSLTHYYENNPPPPAWLPAILEILLD